MKWITLIWMLLTGNGYAQELPKELTKVWSHGVTRMTIHKIPKPKQYEILGALSKVAAKHNISSDDQLMVLAIIEIESHFRQYAKSPAKAQGLMQLTKPAIADARTFCGIKRRIRTYNIVDNIEGGICYLLWLKDMVGDDWVKILIAYNGGAKRIRRYDQGKSIPCETANYVLKVFRINNRDL